MRVKEVITIFFAACVIAIGGFVLWRAWPPNEANLLSLANFLIGTLTLVVLVWYAYDTNSIARVTLERWRREGVLSPSYEMQLVGEKGSTGRTLFRLHNLSALIVTAKVACNFRVYGEAVAYHPAYDGKQTWTIFPHQVSQGWFEIAPLLQKKGKTVSVMVGEHSPVNAKQQLTMSLELEFWDELGAHRKLPGRKHYFDFGRWAWIPYLTDESQS